MIHVGMIVHIKQDRAEQIQTQVIQSDAPARGMTIQIKADTKLTVIYLTYDSALFRFHLSGFEFDVYGFAKLDDLEIRVEDQPKQLRASRFDLEE